jgi:hypothetical protein
MHRDHRGAMYAAGAVLELLLSTEDPILTLLKYWQPTQREAVD